MALWSSVGVLVILVYSWREKTIFECQNRQLVKHKESSLASSRNGPNIFQNQGVRMDRNRVLPEEHHSRNGVTKNASEALFGFFNGKTVIFMMWVWCLKASRSRMKMGCRTFIVKNVGSFWCTITRVWLHFFNILQCGFTTLQYRFHRCSFWILLMVTLAVSKCLKSGGGTLQGLIQLQPQSDPIEHRYPAFELELSSYPRLERTCYRKNGCLSENRVYSQWNSHLMGIMIINHWV